MQVNSISGIQPQFKGNFALYNAKQNGKEIAYKVISTEGMKIERVLEHLTYAPKTLIRTATNEIFEVNVPFKTVEAAYKRIADTDETENIIPPSEFSTPGFFG